MAELRLGALVVACGAFALCGRAAAADDDGDAAMARVLAACPGAARADHECTIQAIYAPAGAGAPSR
jgi:hypothetical protein